jgi:cell division protein FtsQ
VDFPVSSFDLDLPAMQDRIEELDAVDRADLRIRPGGILQIEVRERVPAVVWRTAQGLELLDAEGHRVSSIESHLKRMDLPLLAGEGADEMVPEALEVLATAEPVASRIRGLVRMGERRWTLVLDRDQSILLPESRPVQALEQVMALEHAQDLLARDIAVVDMRNENRPTLRMSGKAVEELRRAKGLVAGAGAE